MPRRRRSGAVALVIFLLIILCTAVFGGVFLANTVTTALNPALTEDGETIFGDTAWGGKINILVIGMDGTVLTDTLILMQVDTKAKTVKSISIPRDTRVLLSGSYIKINSAYAYKGREKSTMQAVKTLTALPIHYYVTINPSGFRNIIDYLGGIDFNVPQDMKYSDPVQGLYIDLKAGPQHLDGKKAEQYVRYRKGYANQDIGRMHAQQEFLKELIKQKFTLSNITRANSIFEELKKYISTNFTLSEAVSMINKLKGMDTENYQTFDVPGEAKMIDGQSFWVVDTEKMKEVVANF